MDPMRPFPPIAPLELPDEDERLQAAVRAVRRRRQHRALSAAVLAVAVLVPVSWQATRGGARPQVVQITSPPVTPTDAVATTTPLTSVPATLPAPAVATTNPPTRSFAPTSLSAPPTAPPTSVAVTTPPAPTTTSAGHSATSGIVTAADGTAVAGAYVIGLDSLFVTRTNDAGMYSVPCNREPLLAATFVVPIGKAGSSAGSQTTPYTSLPSAPGSGYIFSGGATSVSSATSEACDGRPVNFTLPAGGTVLINFTTATGAPLTSVSGSAPIDNLYLPGLGTQAAPAVAPTSASGTQTLTQLGGGSLRIEGTSGNLTCTGPGVASDSAVSAVSVTVTPGKVATVTCRTG